MQTRLAAIAGALLIAMSASSAEAIPLGAAGSGSSAGDESAVIKVHGLHSACRLDRRGWHRSYIWGRQWCAPPHRHYGKKRWKKRY